MNHEKIQKLKDLIDFYIKKDNDFNFKPISRIERHIELLELGVNVEEVKDGFLINDKFIIAAQKNRWRNNNQWKWYWFKDIPTFYKLYIK